jgi:hypothetical protein
MQLNSPPNFAEDGCYFNTPTQPVCGRANFELDSLM